jgi:hypothetical protein
MGRVLGRYTIAILVLAIMKGRHQQGHRHFRARLPEGRHVAAAIPAIERPRWPRRQRPFATAAQGRSHVVRRMFADVDADIYVLWMVMPPAALASRAIIARLIDDRLDMVVAARSS